MVMEYFPKDSNQLYYISFYRTTMVFFVSKKIKKRPLEVLLIVIDKWVDSYRIEKSEACRAGKFTKSYSLQLF